MCLRVSHTPRQHLYIAFAPGKALYTWNTLWGNHVTVMVENLDDLAGNRLEGMITWGFDVERFDESLTASVLQLSFKDLSIDLYYSAPDESRQNFTKTIQDIVGNDVDVIINDVSAGSIVVDFTLQPNGLLAGTKLLDFLNANGSNTENGRVVLQKSSLVRMADGDVTSALLSSRGCDGTCYTGSEFGVGVGISAGLVLLSWLLLCAVCWRKSLSGGFRFVCCQLRYIPSGEYTVTRSLEIAGDEESSTASPPKQKLSKASVEISHHVHSRSRAVAPEPAALTPDACLSSSSRGPTLSAPARYAPELAQATTE